MLDVSVSYNRYKFLGHEFLTWLWFSIDTQPDLFNRFSDDPVSLHIGNRLVLENRTDGHRESVIIKGDDAGLEEGLLALRKGAHVTEANLTLSAGATMRWTFTLKGENLNISGFAPPQTQKATSDEDIDGAVLEKIYFYDQVLDLIDSLFAHFIHLRISERWTQSVLPAFHNWLSSRSEQSGKH